MPPACDRRLDCRAVETGERQAILARAVLDEAVGNTEIQSRYGVSVGSEAFDDRAAGAARDDVFLDSDQRAVRAGDAQDQLFVERLDEAQVHQRRIQLLGDAL